MTRFRESTKNAEKKVWPEVRARLAKLTTPIVIDKLMRTKQSRSNVRYVVEETIDAIAKAGLLRTPADADVIGKAVAWHEAWGDEVPDVDMDDENGEYELYNAVEAMLTEIGDKPHA